MNVWFISYWVLGGIFVLVLYILGKKYDDLEKKYKKLLKERL